MNNDDYISYFVNTPVSCVNYCDGLGRCFRFICIYACAAVFLSCYRIFDEWSFIYRRTRVCVAVSAGREREPCKNGWTDRHTNWVMVSWEPKKTICYVEVQTPTKKGLVRVILGHAEICLRLIISKSQTYSQGGNSDAALGYPGTSTVGTCS